MKKPVKWAAGAVLAAIVAAGFVPLAFWSARLQAELADQVLRTTALEASTQGRVTIAVLPYPRVTYENVTLGHPDGTVAMTARRLTANVNVARLLMGRIEFAGVRLLEPAIVIDADGGRPANAPAIQRAIDAPSSSEEARKADRARLGAVKIVGGSLRVRTREEFSFVVEAVNASIEWPNLGSSAVLSGRGVWRGEKIGVEALLGKPGEVLRGEKSPFTLKLSSRVLDLAIDGALAGGARWMLEARVASSSERFAQFLALMNAQPAVPGRLSRFALSGQLRALPQSTTLSDLRLTLDASTFDGSLTLLQGEKRPKVSGTLATRAYDLRTSETGLPVLRRERQWSREGIAIGRLDAFDADLRISAASLNVGRFALSDVGMIVALDDGKLEITTGGAEAYGGSLRGRWTFDSRSAVPEMAGAGSFRNINLAAFLRSIGHPNIATGAASGEFRVETRGSNVHAMMQNASGTAQTTIRAPEIIGVDLERALRRTERRPLSIPAEVRSGQTSFLTADIDARIDQGVLAFNRAIAAGHGVEVAVSGEIALADRTMRLDIAARQPRPAKPLPEGREPAVILLDLEGPWEDPALSIDPETLINRSEAAAPLLRRQQAPLPANTPAER
ncbi:MAG: AsmA family protein [Beijerinckiaceae bacterium]|nr:AsmA family protein [Beijerinckiaceae bacterium]